MYWMKHEDDPTLAIQFPWDSHPSVTCLNCNRNVSNMYAQRHALVDRDTEGCGIEFKFVATAASDEVWKQWVRDQRPDLEYREVRWA